MQVPFPLILGRARPIHNNIQTCHSIETREKPTKSNWSNSRREFCFSTRGYVCPCEALTLWPRTKLSGHQSLEKVGGTQPIDTRRFRQGTNGPKPHLIHQGFLG